MSQDICETRKPHSIDGDLKYIRGGDPARNGADQSSLKTKVSFGLGVTSEVTVGTFRGNPSLRVEFTAGYKAAIRSSAIKLPHLLPQRGLGSLFCLMLFLPGSLESFCHH